MSTFLQWWRNRRRVAPRALSPETVAMNEYSREGRGAVASGFPYLGPAFVRTGPVSDNFVQIEMPDHSRFVISHRENFRAFLRLFSERRQNAHMTDRMSLYKILKELSPHDLSMPEWAVFAEELRNKLLEVCQREGLTNVSDLIYSIHRAHPDDTAYALWAIGLQLHRFIPGYTKTKWENEIFKNRHLVHQQLSLFDPRNNVFDAPSENMNLEDI